MKKNIHPKYHQSKVTCACGNAFSVGSTLPEIHVEICSVCHPFYTGKQKLLDTARRVEKFQSRVAMQKGVAAGRRGKKVKKAKAAARKKQTKPVKETKEQ